MRNTNYFGRICRFLGRIGLFASFILCVGVGILLIANPFVSEDALNNNRPDSSAAPAAPHHSGVPYSLTANLAQNQILSWFITAAIIAAAVIALIYLAYKYNATIRKVIANIAKRSNSPIHMIELGLTLITWSTLLIMLIFSFPLAATILIFPFILNELLFLFGWISYGMPDYKV